MVCTYTDQTFVSRTSSVTVAAGFHLRVGAGAVLQQGCSSVGAALVQSNDDNNTLIVFDRSQHRLIV